MKGLTRRRFFQALAASVVAAGLPLPIGMPVEAAAPKVMPARPILTINKMPRFVRQIVDENPEWIACQPKAPFIVHSKDLIHREALWQLRGNMVWKTDLTHFK